LNPNAAGDAFTAGLTVRYIETGFLKQAVRFGCAVGALAVMKNGAQKTMPFRKEVDDFLKSHQSV